MLPTKQKVFNHYLHIVEEKTRIGEWHKTTEMSLKAMSVSEDIAELWNRAELPHLLAGKKSRKIGPKMTEQSQGNEKREIKVFRQT